LIGKSFFDVPQQELETSAGKAKFPIFYYDVSALQCYYWVPKEKVEPFLRDTPWQPALFGKDRVLVGIAWYEYRDTDIGPYNEVGLAVGVYPKNTRPPWSSWLNFTASSVGRKLGFYILHLPVTTQIAHAAGVEMWGYPKFVTNIEFSVEQDLFTGTVQDPSGTETIVRLTGEVSGGLPFPGLDLVLYSTRGAEPLRTVVNTKVIFRNLRGISFTMELGSAQHPMRSTLAALGLAELHPWLVQYSDRFQSRLNLGERRTETARQRAGPPAGGETGGRSKRREDPPYGGRRETRDRRQ